MNGKFALAIAALLVTSVSYAQSPPPFAALRARMQPTPITASPVSMPQVQVQKTPVQPAAVSSQGVPAQFVGHHRAGGCSTCGSAPAADMSGGCACGGDIGFVGSCCPDFTPCRARGVWNSYCGSGGCGHFGGGCGMGHGRCCSKVPIGMYGTTPYGCCLSGVGFGRCGGGCGGGCAMGCNSGCGHKAHGCGCRMSGWRWGAGGYGCDGTVGCSAGCSDCASNGSAAPAYDNYESAPAHGMPHEAAPAVPAEEVPVAPMDPPSTPTSEKSARKFLNNIFPNY